MGRPDHRQAAFARDFYVTFATYGEGIEVWLRPDKGEEDQFHSMGRYPDYDTAVNSLVPAD